MDATYSPQSRAERLIATGRVVLAASSLFAVWLDPSEPAKYAGTAYALLAAYVAYAVVIAVQVWRSDTPSNRHRLVTHAFDLCFFSLFIYFTSGTASPFTAYFVFSLVCATLRWQWQGTLWTALVSLAAFLAVGIYFSQVVEDPAFEPYPLVVRGVYLAVVAVLLGYLGAHEERTRRDMTMLATWPAAAPQRVETLVRALLEHAVLAMGSPRVLLVWTEREEPWHYLGVWNQGVFTSSRMSPGTLGQLVAEPLRDAAFLCPDVGRPAPTVLRGPGGALQRWPGPPLDPELLRRFIVHAVLSLPFRGESAEGRLFFLEKPRMTSDDLVLGEIVAGVVCSRLDHFYLTQRLQETVATEERIRLARDLHDGVLQSLTGVGLRLAAVRGLLEEDPRAAREGMEALQRLIALEQRDLRFFIQELKPSAQGPAG
ncbi:MAG TPA: histidine kinase dimerization/phosphoacceptor domain-containing protein, partial [Thermoanaerobaculia bacterium]|nr:histidine kinase dimerization/phosphoacceptor domain-containing protein [Thermoanaerobaculia bacterium]